jgi:hypothetical protein
MSQALDEIAALVDGPLYWFRDWPNNAVPQFGAGVHTIWHRDGRFIYVGMSGRSIVADTAPRPFGLHTRLHSHFGGRRSGDQFCVYVADRLVLGSLAATDIESISSGHHQMDAHVRQYIHSYLGYRFAILADGGTALKIERSIRRGEWSHGKPLLNPSG